MIEQAQQTDAGMYTGLSFIDPHRIFGFPGKDAIPEIKDHPEFPNPRTSALDQDLINDIREAGSFIEPIKLYEYNNEYILVDGKTRLTAAAQEFRIFPETDKFQVVPYILLRGTPDEIRMMMALFNLNESRRPLSAIETAKHLIYMRDVHGMSEEEQAQRLNKTGRGGIRWIREMIAVAEKPDVVEAVAAGTIDVVTAKQVAKIEEPEARQEVIQQVVEKKAEGKSEVEARKEVKAVKPTGTKAGVSAPLRAGNRTTLTFKETLNNLADFYREAKAIYCGGEIDVDTVDFTDMDQCIRYVTQQELKVRFETYVMFFKLSMVDLLATFNTLESWFGSDLINSLDVAVYPGQKAEAPKAEEPVVLKAVTGNAKAKVKGKRAKA